MLTSCDFQMDTRCDATDISQRSHGDCYTYSPCCRRQTVGPHVYRKSYHAPTYQCPGTDRKSKATKTIPDGLHCRYIYPIAPNNNTKLRPKEKHNKILRFTTGEDFLGLPSYLRLDNSFLVPLEKLKILGSIQGTENQLYFDN